MSIISFLMADFALQKNNNKKNPHRHAAMPPLMITRCTANVLWIYWTVYSDNLKNCHHPGYDTRMEFSWRRRRTTTKKTEEEDVSRIISNLASWSDPAGGGGHDDTWMCRWWMCTRPSFLLGGQQPISADRPAVTGSCTHTHTQTKTFPPLQLWAPWGKQAFHIHLCSLNENTQVTKSLKKEKKEKRVILRSSQGLHSSD